jgi:hypothetical protein
MGEYDKYICTELHKREMLPGPTPEQRDKLAAEGLRIRMEHVLWLDSDIIPGGYYGESTWIWPQSYPNQITPAELEKRTSSINPMSPHDHSFPEILSWWGTDPDHPENTTTMGLLLDDEEIPLERSFVAYIPAGMKHMPTRPPNGKVSSRPVCHWTSGPGGVYDREKETEAVKPKPQNERATVSIKKTGPFKNEKYIVYGYNKDVKRPPYMGQADPRYTRPVAYIDQTIIPDAEFGCDTMWLLPGDKSKTGQQMMEAHTLPHGTSLTLTSLNYDDITDLCAEVEFWIGGEKHIINKSFGAYIPPDVEQGPLIVRNIKKQLLFNMSQPIGQGVKKYRGGR